MQESITWAIPSASILLDRNLFIDVKPIWSNPDMEGVRLKCSQKSAQEIANTVWRQSRNYWIKETLKALRENFKPIFDCLYSSRYVSTRLIFTFVFLQVIDDDLYLWGGIARS